MSFGPLLSKPVLSADAHFSPLTGKRGGNFDPALRERNTRHILFFATSREKSPSFFEAPPRPLCTGACKRNVQYVLNITKSGRFRQEIMNLFWTESSPGKVQRKDFTTEGRRVEGEKREGRRKKKKMLSKFSGTGTPVPLNSLNIFFPPSPQNLRPSVVESVLPKSRSVYRISLSIPNSTILKVRRMMRRSRATERFWR